MRNLILAAAVAFALPAAAQSPAEPTPATRAMAAGYKALMVCGAVKNAGAAGGSRTVESVEANELVGIYPELDGLVREMPVVMGERTVSVAWDAALPPRTAVWSPGRGCVIMPVGWTGEPIATPSPGAPANAAFPAAAPMMVPASDFATDQVRCGVSTAKPSAYHSPASRSFWSTTTAVVLAPSP